MQEQEVEKFTTKQGDTGIPFRIRIYGGKIDLTGWTATLTVFKKGASANKIDKKPMTLLDQSQPATKGWFEYYPTAAEVDTKGKFLAEVDVLRPDEKKLTFPRDGDKPHSFFDFIVLESRD